MSNEGVPVADLLIHAGFVSSLAHDLVRDTHSAEDLAQEAWLRALRRPPRDATSLRGWFATLLQNLRRNRDRNERRRRAREATASPPDVASAGQILEREHVRERLVRAVLRLDEPFRTAVLLRYYENLSAAEIARRLAVPAATVRTRLARGLARLREALDDDPRGGRAWVVPMSTWVKHRGGGAAALVVAGIAMKKIVFAAAVVLLALLFAVSRDDPTPATGTMASTAAGPVASTSDVPVGLHREMAVSTGTALAGPAAGGIVFVGRCIDEATSAPLANVAAAAYFDVATRDVCDNELAADTPAGRVVSGPDGAFRIACERRAGATYDVRVGNREHVHRVRSYGPYDADRTIELGDVSLARGVHVSLRVVDRRGAPVTRVRLTAYLNLPVGSNDMLMLDETYPWRSDAQGEIHLPYSMPPGRAEIRWWGDELLPQDRFHATLEVPAGSAEHHAVLVWPVEDVADAISGEVVEATGNPVANVSIGAEGGGTRGNARTSADGTFRMVRIGPYDANARGPVEFGLPPPTCGLELVDAPTAAWGDRGVRLVVRPVATLRVRAVDPATGETVREVDAACAACDDNGAAPKVVWSRYSPLERLPDGTVRRRLARCRHEVQVFPKNGQLAPSFKVVWDPAAGDELVVPLTPLRACTVRVVTMDGEPVTGTELWMLQPIEAVDGSPAAAGWREVALPVADELRLDPTTRWGRHGIDDAPLGTTRTGADGRAQVLVPANADVVVAALGPGHVPRALVGRAGGDAEVEIRVVRGASVRFVLTPKEVVQRLLPSARHARIVAAATADPVTQSVGLQLLRIEPEQDPQLPDPAIVIPISPDGTCEHRGLRPGRYATALAGRIESGAMDGVDVEWQPGPVTVRDGERNEIPIDVSRWAVGRLQCQVLLNGKPWAFGSGQLWSQEMPDERAGAAGYLMYVPKHLTTVKLRTDGDGRFDVEAVPGDYCLHLRDISYAVDGGSCCAVEPVHVVAGATRQLVLTARDVTARVRVVDAAGAPAPGLTVTADYTTVPKTGVEWTTDADGWFTMRLAPLVPFHLVVKNPDGSARAGRRTASAGDAVLGPFEVPPSGDTAEFRAVLPEGWR